MRYTLCAMLCAFMSSAVLQRLLGNAGCAEGNARAWRHGACSAMGMRAHGGMVCAWRCQQCCPWQHDVCSAMPAMLHMAA